MKVKSLATVVFVGVVFWLISFVWSEPIKPLIYYTKTEKGLGNKTYTFRFSFWDVEVGGNQVWEEEKTLTAKKSTISTLLGDVSSIDGVDFSQQIWIQVERLENGNYVLVGERELLAVSGVPYALWSLTPAGPKGDKGDKGDTGPQGPKGDTGATGPQGPTGATGATGPMGAQGLQGPAGVMGPTGPQGAQGAVGPQGPIGLTGSQGPVGPAGPQGPMGATGPIGPTGAQGLTGVTGPQGAVGPTGATGAAGTGFNWIGPWVAGNYVAYDVVEYNGSSYVATADTNAQPPGAPWELMAQAGATGATGPTGQQGTVGPTGLQGPTGPAGPTGATGTAGTAGTTGPTGPTGAAGSTGPTGATGLQGPPGVAAGAQKIVAGSIKDDGTILSGSGFTVTHVGSGSYHIVFTSGPSQPICTATNYSPSQGWTTLYTPGIDLWVLINNKTSSNDDYFQFICVFP